MNYAPYIRYLSSSLIIQNSKVCFRLVGYQLWVLRIIIGKWAFSRLVFHCCETRQPCIIPSRYTRVTTIFNTSVHTCTHLKTFIHVHLDIHLRVCTTKSAIIANSCILINMGYRYIIVCLIRTSGEIGIDIILRSAYPNIVFPIPSLVFRLRTVHPFFIFFFAITTRVTAASGECFCCYICMNIIFHIGRTDKFGVFLPTIISVNRNRIFRITTTFFSSNNHYSIRCTYPIQSS